MATEPQLIGLAEKIIGLLDEGARSATYKFAVLLGLMDRCFELSGEAAEPVAITTYELAEKVIELYLPHTAPYAIGGAASILRQGGTSAGQQAEILTLLTAFRERHRDISPFATVGTLRKRFPAFEKLVRDVEWKLVEMPLPRLQRVGTSATTFLYDIGWNETVKRKDLSGPAFDNRIILKAGVAEGLVRLAGLLRPLIYRHWAHMVATMNGIEEARLEAFLFGSARIPLVQLAGPLQDLQDRRCFYCTSVFGAAEKARPEVDHFIPWARYRDNGLANLVVAHRECNGRKRDHFADVEHLDRWRKRLTGDADAGLRALATDLTWEFTPERTLSVAKSLYLRLPEQFMLWEKGASFVPLQHERLRAVLTG